VADEQQKHPHHGISDCLVAVNPGAASFCTGGEPRDNQHGLRIVWQDSRNTSSGSDIYMYDIGTGLERAVCTATRTQYYPDIDGDLIVWQDDRYGSGYVFKNDIFLYDLGTSSEKVVTKANGFQLYPAISGQRIVWHDTRDANPPNIYMYDLDAQTESPVWTAEGSQSSPDIANHRVVCLDNRSGYPNISMYDLDAQTETAITNVDSQKESPAICGDRIVWADMRNGNWDIYIYDLSTGLERRLVGREGAEQYPAVSEAGVVWVDFRNGPDGDLYFYDFALERETPLVVNPDRQSYPAVSGSRIVWEDDRNGNSDIYYLDYVPPTGADLEITKRDYQDPVLVGDYIVYFVEVRNLGPDTAEGVVAVDTLSDDVEFVSASSTRGLCQYTTLEDKQLVICPMGDLEDGWTGQMTIVVRTTETGRISNRATVDASTDDPVAVNNDLTISTKVVEFLSKNLGEGWAAHLESDATGKAHLSYTRNGQRRIDHFPWPSPPIVHAWDDIIYASNRSGRWVKQIVFEGIGHPDPWNVGNPHYYYEQAVYSDIAIDADGDVHIAYVVDDVELNVLGNVVNESHRIEYIKHKGGSWSSPKVVQEVVLWEDGGYRGAGIWSMDLEVGPAAEAHVAFIRSHGMASQGPLLYCTNASGQWTSELVATAYDHAAIAVDGAARAHLAYYSWDILHDDSHVQGIAYRTNAPAGTWQTPEAVDSDWKGGQMEGMVCDIAIDSQNRPQISYVSGQGEPREDYRHALKEGGVWVASLVSTGQFTSADNSIDTGPGDYADILYYDLTEQQSMYTSNESGSWVKHDMGDADQYGMEIATDPAGGVHIVQERAEKLYYRSRRAADADRDGVPDAFEQGPYADDAAYDGNGDGTPDSQQDNVASFYSSNDYAYITMACSQGVLANVGVQDNPSPPDVPEDWGFIFDFLGFMVTDLPIGGAVTVTLYLPEGSNPQVYYKYGPTAAQPTPHWYPFMYDGQTGAVINDNVITLHFVDGQRGDNDLIANGVIIDPGAPAVYQPCIVDVDDLVKFADEWLFDDRTPALNSDFNADGKVDMSDFAALAAAWLAPCPQEWPRP
jgi:TolB protein